MFDILGAVEKCSQEEAGGEWLQLCQRAERPGQETTSPGGAAGAESQVWQLPQSMLKCNWIHNICSKCRDIISNCMTYVSGWVYATFLCSWNKWQCCSMSKCYQSLQCTQRAVIQSEHGGDLCANSEESTCHLQLFKRSLHPARLLLDEIFTEFKV